MAYAWGHDIEMNWRGEWVPATERDRAHPRCAYCRQCLGCMAHENRCGPFCRMCMEHLGVAIVYVLGTEPDLPSYWAGMVLGACYMPVARWQQLQMALDHWIALHYEELNQHRIG